ncbi:MULTISPECIES: hypothetical protein [Bradyrhizobium]|jgi:hypothetical protein|uniref:hypothetical protein n=1 Tax=Bradyrhizobium TaxID=374 RepID=UPI000464081A|nr:MULTISPECIES: hypothetical protein [Bradyrhizobium]KIU52576.1 hypothetical protein QU41_02635 [Bradyrhizobium elkanii]MBK5656750.1 hypothetical protein [Rhizobium sp.]OCX32680.1 hypothetical protein QU42_02740 [Bradyrhizobium sp. UASWS1016]
MILFSYCFAAAAMLAAALYLIFRLRLFVATSTMLLGGLLLVYGPAFLSYTLSSGEQYFLIKLFSGAFVGPHPIFSIITSKLGDIHPVIIAMNLSIGLMYVSIIAGMELRSQVAPAQLVVVEKALSDWKSHKLEGELRDLRFFGIIILGLASFMIFISWKEDHLRTISDYFSIKDQLARTAFRSHGGSPDYLYRVILSAVAPIFVVWGGITAILRKSWLLATSTCLLVAATMLGNVATLSKAPPAFFVLQIATAIFLVFTNRLSWKLLFIGAVCIFFVINATMSLMMVFPDASSAFSAAYSRVFEAENQSLFENFATFPQIYPHMWGTNIRPIAILTGEPYTPAYRIVARLWYGTDEVTSPSLFIADAWADFSYLGVIVFSFIAGIVCRSLDLTFLALGKSPLTIAMLSAAVFGILTLLTTALGTALLSGGLLLAPMLALAVLAADHLIFDRLNTRSS